MRSYFGLAQLAAAYILGAPVDLMTEPGVLVARGILDEFPGPASPRHRRSRNAPPKRKLKRNRLTAARRVRRKHRRAA